MKKIISLLCLAIMGLAPLVFSRLMIHGFAPVKGAIIQILAELLLIALCIDAAKNGIHLKKPSLIEGAFIAYIIAAIIATLFGIDPGLSLIGLAGRQDGLIFLLHLAVFFAGLRIALRQEGFIGNAVLVNTTAAAGVALIAGIQFINGNTELVTSTIGNKILLTTYLSMVFFIAAMGVKNDRRLRVLYFVLLAIIGAGVFISGSRGGVLSMVAGIGYIIFSNLTSRTKKQVLIGITLLSVLAVSIFASGLYSLSRVTLDTRVTLWKMGIESTVHSALIGHGPSSFPVQADIYYNPELVRTISDTGWFDKTHNVFIDELVEKGLLGLTAFLILLVAAWREARGELMIVRAGLLAYCVAGFFSMNSPEILVILIFLIACANIGPDSSIESPQSNSLKKVFGLLLVPIVILSIWILVAGNIRTLQIGRNLLKLLFATTNSNVSAFVQAHKNLTSRTLFQDQLFAEGLVVINSFVEKNPHKTDPYIKSAILEMNRVVVTRFPYFSKSRYLLARHLIYDSKTNEHHAKEAKEILDILVQDFPRRPLFYIGQIQLATTLGKTEEARLFIAQAKALDPLSTGTAVFIINILIDTGDIETAVSETQAMSEKLGMDIARRVMGRFASMKRWDIADRIFTHLHNSVENFNASDFFSWAYYESQLSKKEEAIKHAQQAARLDPAFEPHAKKLIEDLQ